jgi:membrane protease YdiL (CAAX protease family)
LFTIGILRIPAAARIFHQGFLSPGLEYLTEIPAAICLLVCGLVMARIEKRGLGDYGLSLRRGASKHFLWGLFWGLCVFSGVIALIAALHGFSFGGLALHGLALLKYASLWAIGFLLVGFVEEFLYRGYVQFTLAEAIGFWPSAIVWSLVFAAMHLANPDEKSGRSFGGFSVRDFCLSDSASNGRSMVRHRFSCGRRLRRDFSILSSRQRICCIMDLS